MFALLLLFVLLVASGSAVAAMLALPTCLARWLMGWTAASAQLVVSVQVLSVVHLLDGAWLLGLNALVTTGVLLLARRAAPALVSRHPQFLSRGWRFEHWVMLACGGVMAVWLAIAIGSSPSADPYHFTMPVFWAQQRSILPVPAYDPRLNGVVFAAHALAFPGFLFARTELLLHVLAAAGGAGTLWIVGALARQLGATRASAVCAAAMLLGVGPFVSSLLGGKAEAMLSAMWFAGSLYLLIEARLRKAQRSPLLGCAVFCFAMAAGTKNVALLHLPLLMVFAVVLFGFGAIWRELKPLLLWGGAGIVASGLLWSYASNQLWYGDWRGHPFLRETISQQIDLHAIWTRCVRGAVMAAADPIWLPMKWQPAFAACSQQAVSALGAGTRLAEDAGFYVFDSANIRPGKGFGLVAAFVILPSLILATWKVCRRRDSIRFKALLRIGMLLTGIGSCVVFFIALRWQTIGPFRLMLTCAVALVPLCGLLLERTAARWFALVVTAVSVALYSVSGLVILLRRSEAIAASPPGRLLQQLAHDRSTKLEFRWSDRSVQQVAVRENYTRRELYAAAMAQMPQPTVIGVIGGYNAEVFGLFGERFQNRVVSINDCRNPEWIGRPGKDVAFLVVEDFPFERIAPEITSDFEPWLDVFEEEKLVWRCLKRPGG